MYIVQSRMTYCFHCCVSVFVEIVSIQAGVNGLGAELAEFVRVEWVVVMMRVPLNRVAAIAFLALFICAHSH